MGYQGRSIVALAAAVAMFAVSGAHALDYITFENNFDGHIPDPGNQNFPAGWTLTEEPGWEGFATFERDPLVHIGEGRSLTLSKVKESGDESLRARLIAAPHHGVGDPRADAMAKRLTSTLFKAVLDFPHHIRGRYLPGSIQFTTYEWAGALVTATPDGRADGAPLCDSMGPLEGKSTKGPTAALASAATFAQDLAAGTAVMNIRLSKKTLRESFKPLVLGYFAAGGMQLQVTCASKEDMLDAIDHPERHEDLMVRTGGYSEYFNRLSPELKRTIIARPEF